MPVLRTLPPKAQRVALVTVHHTRVFAISVGHEVVAILIFECVRHAGLLTVIGLGG